MTYVRSPLAASERRCSRCRVVRPIGDFRIRAGRWPSSWCNPCANAANRDYRVRNRIRLAAERRAAYGEKERTASRERFRRRAQPISRVCEWCGITFIRQRASKVCSPECRQHRNQARANARQNPIAQYRRLRILERDGWHCYLCGQPISRKAAYPDPASGTVDHIIPQKHGGPDGDENLGATHWRCNSRKGASSRGLRIGYRAGEPYLLIDREYFAA